jgi:triphosphoribosyl-dephospho-CoA synthase
MSTATVSTAAGLGALAAQALRAELALDPKPGLVTPSRRGSHADMDHATFIASIAALEPYFVDCAALGAAGAGFAELRQRAIVAEAQMLAATGGVNTHKGAIFTLGLLTAAAGWRSAHSPTTAADELGRIVGERWGAALVAHRGELSARGALSNGQRARLLHAVPGAREHAAAGFPTLFAISLPALRLATGRGVSPQRARLHALLTTMAVLPDTNLVHRGGPDGLRWAQQVSEDFIVAGGVFKPGWEARLADLSAAFEARWLSPGGSADLLAAACFVHCLEAAAPAAARPPAAIACVA